VSAAVPLQHAVIVTGVSCSAFTTCCDSHRCQLRCLYNMLW